MHPLEAVRVSQTAAPLLCVAVPTWNRAERLRSLLETLIAQQQALPDPGAVEIVVSDNGSTDATPAVCAAFEGRIRVLRQPQNLGFDRNVLACYQAARARYVLFFSDDDVPAPELLERVLGLLGAYQPAGLLYSFLQPPHTAERPTIDVAEESVLARDTAVALPYLLTFAKLSTYCVRKRAWAAADWAQLEQRLGTNYWFVSLAILTYLRERERGLLLHRPVLAGSGAGYDQGFRFEPGFWATRGQAADVGEFRALAPQRLLETLEADPLLAVLRDLRDHYAGSMSFDAAALRRGEQRAWHQRRQWLAMRRLFVALEYLAYKYVRWPGLRGPLLSGIPLLRRALWLAASMPARARALAAAAR